MTAQGPTTPANPAASASESDRILILDFGSQFTQLIARRIREQHVYCEIHPAGMSLAALRAWQPDGIVLSGGPSSVLDPGAPGRGFSSRVNADRAAPPPDSNRKSEFDNRKCPSNPQSEIRNPQSDRPNPCSPAPDAPKPPAPRARWSPPTG